MKRSLFITASSAAALIIPSTPILAIVGRNSSPDQIIKGLYKWEIQTEKEKYDELEPNFRETLGLRTKDGRLWKQQGPHNAKLIGDFSSVYHQFEEIAREKISCGIGSHWTPVEGWKIDDKYYYEWEVNIYSYDEEKKTYCWEFNQGTIDYIDEYVTV